MFGYKNMVFMCAFHLTSNLLVETEVWSKFKTCMLQEQYFTHFKLFLKKFDMLLIIRLKVLRSDYGGEYLFNNFKQYPIENSIQYQLTMAYTTQQNGVDERMNRTLLDLVRSILHHKGI